MSRPPETCTNGKCGNPVPSAQNFSMDLVAHQRQREGCRTFSLLALHGRRARLSVHHWQRSHMGLSRRPGCLSEQARHVSRRVDRRPMVPAAVRDSASGRGASLWPDAHELCLAIPQEPDFPNRHPARLRAWRTRGTAIDGDVDGPFAYTTLAGAGLDSPARACVQVQAKAGTSAHLHPPAIERDAPTAGQVLGGRLPS